MSDGFYLPLLVLSVHDVLSPSPRSRILPFHLLIFSVIGATLFFFPHLANCSCCSLNCSFINYGIHTKEIASDFLFGGIYVEALPIIFSARISGFASAMVAVELLVGKGTLALHEKQSTTRVRYFQLLLPKRMGRKRFLCFERQKQSMNFFEGFNFPFHFLLENKMQKLKRLLPQLSSFPGITSLSATMN